MSRDKSGSDESNPGSVEVGPICDEVIAELPHLTSHELASIVMSRSKFSKELLDKVAPSPAMLVHFSSKEKHTQILEYVVHMRCRGFLQDLGFRDSDPDFMRLLGMLKAFKKAGI